MYIIYNISSHFVTAIYVFFFLSYFVVVIVRSKEFLMRILLENVQNELWVLDVPSNGYWHINYYFFFVVNNNIIHNIIKQTKRGGISEAIRRK